MSVQFDKTVTTVTVYKSGSVLLTVEEREGYTNYLLNMTGVKAILSKEEMQHLLDVIQTAWREE